ncbi:hypothetical protein HBI56_126010 [Parastagonospora nodorum]|nr:hypothetical protein HBH54_030450 [Parastagonospora nodorum]KAH4145047.1 hypothetical protein HBH45_020940 [Parastagonospora nodorum]KAH4175398.1 hypothetical protein HBH44_009950 [Parastagonospora nodorum]KAH4311396.1 hypothetical protein HBI01_019520 [Parastagonospora nodorum]KAH4316838.1 hypothetical protein HBI02_035860 [Parastagonospora nodorum]
MSSRGTAPAKLPFTQSLRSSRRLPLIFLFAHIFEKLFPRFDGALEEIHVCVCKITQGVFELDSFDAFKVRYLLDGVLVKGFGCFLRVLHFTGKAFNFDFEFTDTLAPSLLVVDAAEVFDLGPQEA